MRRPVMLAVRYAKASALLVFALLLVACSSEPPPAPPASDMAASLFLSGTELSVLDVEDPDDEWEPSPAPQDADSLSLQWELRDRDGAVIAGGTIADPRVARSEFDESGQPAPVESAVTSMFIDLTLPSTGGELSLFAAPAPGGTTNHPQAAPAGAPIAKVSVPAKDPGSTSKTVTKPSGTAIGKTIKIVDHGNCRTPINVLIVPDGFRASEMKKFHTEAARVAKALFGFDGYKQHAISFNVWRQDIASKQSGAGDPETGKYPDTAFKSSYGEGDRRRCLYPRGTISAATAKTLKDAKKASRASAVAIIVNAEEYGGCATPQMVAVSSNVQATAVLPHELGHGLFLLADEYDYGECNSHAADSPNTAHHLDNLPWESMLTVPQSSLPTEDDSGTRDSTIGAYAGADYCKKGAYRPQHDCLMRSLDHQLCRVCRAEVTRVINARVAKLKKQGKKVCSAKPPSTTPGEGTLPPLPGGGEPKPSCLGPSPCTDCLAAKCNATTSACLGPDWQSGDVAGPCGPYMSCFCSCTDDTASCAQECAPLNSESCTSCLTSDYSACIQTSCSDVCK